MGLTPVAKVRLMFILGDWDDDFDDDDFDDYDDDDFDDDDDADDDAVPMAPVIHAEQNALLVSDTNSKQYMEYAAIAAGMEIDPQQAASDAAGHALTAVATAETAKQRQIALNAFRQFALADVTDAKFVVAVAHEILRELGDDSPAHGYVSAAMDSLSLAE